MYVVKLGRVNIFIFLSKLFILNFEGKIAQL